MLSFCKKKEIRFVSSMNLVVLEYIIVSMHVWACNMFN